MAETSLAWAAETQARVKATEWTEDQEYEDQPTGRARKTWGLIGGDRAR